MGTQRTETPKQQQQQQNTDITHMPNNINCRLSIFHRLMNCTLLYCFIAHIAFLILCARKISVNVRINRLLSI